MFIEITDVCNFADDDTISDCGKDLSNILENWYEDLKTWYEDLIEMV